MRAPRDVDDDDDDDSATVIGDWCLDSDDSTVTAEFPSKGANAEGLGFENTNKDGVDWGSSAELDSDNPALLSMIDGAVPVMAADPTGV